MTSPLILADDGAIARAAMWRAAPLRRRLQGTTALHESLGFLVPRRPITPAWATARSKTVQLSGASPDNRHYYFDELGGEGRITLSAAEFHQEYGCLTVARH